MGWILCCSAEGQASSHCDAQVKSPEGVGCSRWTHSWNDDQDLRQMPGPSDPAPPRSSNNVYFLSDEANTKGLYLLRAIMIPKWLFLTAVFRPLRTVFRGLGAGFWNLGGQTEKMAKKREKTGKKWARNGLKKVGPMTD